MKSEWMCILLLFAIASASVSGAAQRKKKSPYKPAYWKTDPYTENDPARMKQAGYVSFGPFTWGDDHDVNDIRKMFPTRRFVFVETAHFKIGSSLPEYRLPKGVGKLEKKYLKRDLTELKAFFPKVKVSTRKLDPWLRLHIYALRLERVYAAVSKQLGVTDADFPQKATKRTEGTAKPYGRDYMGQGPYLGMREKFLVLLMAKGANLTRYAAKSIPGTQTAAKPLPQRTYFTKVGSLFFGTALNCAENSLFNDHALHCHVVFNTVHSLIDGYKDFYFALPVWCREGLAHWYVRNLDPKEHCFMGMKGRSNKQRYDHKWDVKIKRRLKHGDFTPAAQIMKFTSFQELTFGDHMAVWSRMDFLLSLGDDKFAKFMSRMKDMIPVAAGQAPAKAAILAQQERALKLAYGFDYAAFDEAWRRYVLSRYPGR